MPADISARNSMHIFSDLLLALTLPPLQKSGSCRVVCLDLWEQGFLCSIYSQSGSWRKGERRTVLPNAEISNGDAGMQFD